MSTHLRAGYKQTEVGIIPEDWDAEKLGTYVEIKSGESPSLFRFETDGIPYFKVEQLNNNGKYLKDTPYYFRGKKTVPRGSLIFPKRGASILLNKIRILEIDSFMDTNLMTLTPASSVHHEFLYYALTHIELWRIADTTSIPQINNKHIIPLVVALPSRKAEQEAIAEALSDTDALIESLEQLLAKKRLLKQGTMQELLTGKKRLPGFSGEWEVRRLGNVCSITTGKKDVNEGNPTGQYPFFTCARTNTFSDSYSFEGEAILIAGNGEVGNLSYCDGKFEAYQRTYVLQDFSANVGYLWQQLSAYLADSLGIGKIGSSIPYIKMGNLIGFEFRSPRDVSEQIAIAAALSDMDAEIADLGVQLAKTRTLKQGMMHKLLTGEIRLL